LKSIRFKIERLETGGVQVIFSDPNDIDDVMDLILTLTKTGEIYKVRTFFNDYIFVPEYYLILWKEKVSPYIHLDKDGKLYFLLTDKFKFVRSRKD